MSNWMPLSDFLKTFNVTLDNLSDFNKETKSNLVIEQINFTISCYVNKNENEPIIIKFPTENAIKSLQQQEVLGKMSLACILLDGKDKNETEKKE